MWPHPARRTTKGVLRVDCGVGLAATAPCEIEWPADDAELGQDVFDACPGHLSSPLGQAAGKTHTLGAETELGQCQATGQLR